MEGRGRVKGPRVVGAGTRIAAAANPVHPGKPEARRSLTGPCICGPAGLHGRSSRSRYSPDDEQERGHGAEGALAHRYKSHPHQTRRLLCFSLFFLIRGHIFSCSPNPTKGWKVTAISPIEYAMTTHPVPTTWYWFCAVVVPTLLRCTALYGQTRKPACRICDHFCCSETAHLVLPVYCTQSAYRCLYCYGSSWLKT
jgi:hypothetical protein